MIYCIWYPSGGFGHFINSILSLHGKGFARPVTKSFKFSSTGDSHELELVAPKYLHNPLEYKFNFDDQFNYSVLIDNGINNEEKKFIDTFPTATVIKMCYDDLSWPVVSKTMINKVLKSSVEEELGTTEWNGNDDWMLREKYFLFFKDHNLRHAWRPDHNVNNLLVTDLIDYSKLIDQFKNFNIECNDFRPLWNEWYVSNYKYFYPMLTGQQIINDVKNNIHRELTHITDVWTQAVVYYYIWLHWRFEVPHNDFSNWFTNTRDIAIMLDTHGALL